MALCRLWDLLDSGAFSLYSPGQMARKVDDTDAEDAERPRGYLCLLDPPTIVSGWLNGNRVIMVDVRNWIRDGIPRDHDAPMPCATLMLTVRNLLRTVRELDLGVMKPTLAGQAFQHWRHLDPKPRVLLPDSKRESRLARAAYFAAPVSCHWIGPRDGPIHQLDVNGMYAHIMSTHLLPTSLVSFVDLCSPQDFESWEALADCAATVQLETDQAYPVRNGAGKVIYAKGRFWTHLCGAELSAAARKGYVIKATRLARYSMGWTCASFADFWLRQRATARDTGDKIRETIAKLMPCALYGRWASRRTGWEPIDVDFDGMRWGCFHYRDWRSGITHPARVIAGKAEADFGHEINVLPVHCPLHLVGREAPKRDVETAHSFPAISAFITAAAREMMSRLRAIAGLDDVFYTCCDSVHVSEVGFRRLEAAGTMHQTDPGKLKKVKTVQSAIYLGANCMVLDGELHASGLPGIHAIARDGKIEATMFERIDSMLSRELDGTVRYQVGSWTPRHNPWGQYNQIGFWSRPPKIGGD
jgi:hypothetical protein